MKDSLTKGMISFNEISQQSTTTRYQNTRSASSFQLRKHDFKTEKYGRFSIINTKCLSDWNQSQSHLQKNLKTLNNLNSKLLAQIISSNTEQYIT